MGRGSVVKKVLNELGLVSRVEVSQARNFLKGALQASKRPLTAEELRVLIGDYLKVLTLDVRGLGNIPKATMVGLGYVLGKRPGGGRLPFISLASPAYVQNLDGKHVDILSGASKGEYHKLQTIKNRLTALEIPHTFEVFLADIDPEVSGKGPDELEALFERNLRGLREVSGINARRLSAVVGRNGFGRLRQRVKKDERLQGRIRALQERGSVKTAHRITAKAIAERAEVYAALGKYLEETLPNIILADIQGRIYPYEQPFYNVLRDHPLPVLRPI